jgi:sideroflexin-5
MARADKEGWAELTEEEHADFQHKKLILTSCMHPDTNEPIPWPMRTSTFIQTNVPIMCGMLMSAPTTRNSILWQWVNQTYNAALNFGNRNASSKQTNLDLLKSYGLAVFVSISSVLTFKRLLAPLARGKTGMAGQMVNYFANWMAVAMSSALNITFVRSGELTTGISVVNPNDPNESLGLSKVCAKEGIRMSATSRFLYTIPIFATTITVNSLLSSMRMLPRAGSPMAMILEVLSVSAGLWIAMPFNCAFYTQYNKISIDKLEPEIQAAAKARGLTHLVYNKGL